MIHTRSLRQPCLFLIAFGVLCVSAAGVIAQDVEPTSLRPKFTEGQASRFSFWTMRDQTITISAGARSGKRAFNYLYEGEVTWTVDRVAADGSADCTMTLDWITARMRGPQGEQLVDSRLNSSDSPRMLKLLQAMSGTPMSVDVAADGSITELTGAEDVARNAGPDIQTPKKIDFIETASDLATAPFAPASANIGDTWQAAFDWTHESGMMHHDATYTLADRESIAGIDVATITYAADLAYTPEVNNARPDDAAVNVQLNRGEETGQIIFDLTRGEAVGRNTVETSQIEIQIQLPDRTIVQIIDERIQSQVLRIAE